MQTEAGRIWPVWVRSLGAMWEAGAIVRFACPRCERVYDVDLEALISLRGRTWSLVDRRARCKASKCRASGAFVAAQTPDQRFIWLHGRDMIPAFVAHSRPRDHEPPEACPEPVEGAAPCPAPPGVDPIRWAYADERERKRMVRLARG
jgi:hypothetical protein